MDSVRLKFVLFVSVMILVFGIMVIIGGVVIGYSVDRAVTDFEPVANSYLDSAISSLRSATNAIGAAQPTLTSSFQMTGDAAGTLLSIGGTVTNFGNALGFDILGWRPLGSYANPIIDVGNQIQGAGSQLQTIGNSLSNTNTQLEGMKASLLSVEANLQNTKNLLPSYFSQAHQAILVVTGIICLFGLLVSLTGGAVLSLRREVNKISDNVLQAGKRYSL